MNTSNMPHTPNKGFGGIVVPVFLLLLLVTGCATDKDAWLNRNFNAMTTRYNGYFNGLESFKEGVVMVESRHEDDYTMVLPVFKYGDQTVASSANSYMDVAIRKAGTQIQKRSMYIRGKERNRMIDNCWMLIGKAHFYKMEYEQAGQTFDFVIARFSDLPTRYDAMLWKIRTNNQLNRYQDNEALFGMLQRSIDRKEAPHRVRRLYPLVRADFFLQQGNLQAAITPLKQAIRVNWRRGVKTRAMYILAQIYHELEQYEEASHYYKRVSNRNPDYEMTFNARINHARCYSMVAGGDGSTIKRQLNRMIRDEKNVDYLDQIYFALAEVYIAENNESIAMDKLRYSVANADNNPNQKALSSLLLADLCFKHENYADAQAYYDSAVTYLERDYPHYDKLMKRHDILSRLVNNIMLVQTQDSLQRLAKMPEGERMRIINGIIAEIERKEREAKERERSNQQFQQFGGSLQSHTRNMQHQQQQTSEWYFDNPATRSFGYTEFRNKWGDRKLEDMWRIHSRRGGVLLTEEELRLDSIRQDSLKQVAARLKEPEFYLENIPLTPEAIEESNLSIERALYNMGYIYFHELSDYDKSIESFSKQVKRFPEGNMVPPAYYQLHQVYNRVGFQDLAARYKNKLTQEYPEHEYAKILADPNYLVNRARETDIRNRFYEQTFALYSGGQLQDARLKVDSALNERSFSEIHPRLSLLQAMIVGKTSGKEAYIDALEHTVASYKGTPESNHAQKLLTLLKPEQTDQPGDKLEASGSIDYSIYSFQDKTRHLVLVVIDNKFGNANRAQATLSDFNRRSFSPKNLNLSSTVLSSNHDMITISSFTDGKDAMTYYNALVSQNIISGADGEGDMAIFVISSENYPIFFKDRDLDKYRAFFVDHYFQ